MNLINIVLELVETKKNLERALKTLEATNTAELDVNINSTFLGNEEFHNLNLEIHQLARTHIQRRLDHVDTLLKLANEALVRADLEI